MVESRYSRNMAFLTTQWEERNRILHSDTTTSEEIRESSINSKIRNLYDIQDTFARSDHYLFRLPLDERLLQTQSTKKQWISIVARYHPTTLAC